MPANPKPKKGAYAAKRKRDRKADRWALAYGSTEYVRAVTSHPCAIAARNGTGPIHHQCVYIGGRSEACHVVKKTRDDELATWRGIWAGCAQHHAEGEGLDPSYYLETYKVDVVREAELMAEQYGHLVPAAA